MSHYVINLRTWEVSRYSVLFKTSILISLIFTGCGSDTARLAYLQNSDGRGKFKYETVAELQDTLNAWNYSNVKALKMSDSVRAFFPYTYQMYLVNEQLEVNDDICEAYFPGLAKKVDLDNQRTFNPPD